MADNNDGDMTEVQAELVPNLPATLGEEPRRIKSERPSYDTPREQSDWRTEHLEANPERRCQAHLSDGSGQQCRRWAVLGGTTCVMHGSGTKAAKAKARERLDAAADPMVKRLLQLAKFADDPIALKAVDSVLDRALGKPVQGIAIGTGDPAPWEEIIYEGISTMTREESRAARGLEPDVDITAGEGHCSGVG